MDRMKLENKDSLMTNPDPEIMERWIFNKFNNERFVEVLKVLLPFLDQRGFLSSPLTMADLPEYLKDLCDNVEEKKTEESVVTVAAVEAVPVAETPRFVVKFTTISHSSTDKSLITVIFRIAVMTHHDHHQSLPQGLCLLTCSCLLGLPLLLSKTSGRRPVTLRLGSALPLWRLAITTWLRCTVWMWT